MSHHILLLLLLPLTFLLLTTTVSAAFIGANYGQVSDNLPPPTTVSHFLSTQTTLTSLKLFDTSPDTLRAFSHSPISLTLNIPNSAVSSLTTPSSSLSWVSSSLLPFLPDTRILYLTVGNEVHLTGDLTLMSDTITTMHSLYLALQSYNLTKHIKVTTPHSLAILPPLASPSSGYFQPQYVTSFFKPILEFHRQTKSPFMVNPYPYFGFNPSDLDFALGNKNHGILDHGSKLRYYNMFDYLLDGVYSAMKRLGYEDVEINVGETGWPSAGDENEPFATMENAVAYNRNLVRRLKAAKGTPLMRNRTFETYIFALFNEDLKPSTSERNYGLFRPDFTPVYDVGLMKTGPQASGPSSSASPVPAAPAPSSSGAGQKWCVAKPDASDEILQGNLDYVCSKGIDCKPIQDGGPCFQPNTVRAHASYAMNTYYHINGQHESDCYFDGSGLVTNSNPSYEACEYVA